MSENNLFFGEKLDIDQEKICFETLRCLIDAGYLSEADIKGCRSYRDYYRLSDAVRDRVIGEMMDRGVRFLSTDGVILSPFARIGEGTLIQPGTQLRQGVCIGANCDIGPNSIIEDSEIGDGCTINATQIYSSKLDQNVKIGPFCHIRPNSHLCEGVKIGDFVEVKNSVVGKDTHASHLTYIGDSDVGERVNFGCGTVCVNYNGYSKNRCVIGDDAFIGCNTNLVAPVTVGAKGYTAAGSTITDDVPSGALAIARARQVNKEGRAEVLKEKYKKK